MKTKIAALVAAVALAMTGACTDPQASAAPKSHTSARHKTAHRTRTSSKVVTAKGHVDGTDHWFLTVKGIHHAVPVTHAVFTRCAIGDHYPSCADK